MALHGCDADRLKIADIQESQVMYYLRLSVNAQFFAIDSEGSKIKKVQKSVRKFWSFRKMSYLCTRKTEITHFLTLKWRDSSDG